MPNKYLIIGMLGSAMLLASCSIFDKNMGQDVSADKEVQLIDPYAGFEDTAATLEGQKAEKLLQEYREETPRAPVEALIKDVGD